MMSSKSSPDRSLQPPQEHKPSQSPKNNGASPRTNALGPVVVFIARATDLNDHHYPGAVLDQDQMHEYLRNLLVITSSEHRKVYGSLGARPHKMQTIIHPANSKLSVLSRITKFLAAALEEARETKSGCIFVLYNWDGWTTDHVTMTEMCEQFKDVPFTFHVYANGHGVPREFFEANAHKVNAYFRRRIRLDDDSIAQDRHTFLFIKMIEALNMIHLSFPPTPDQKHELAKYDSRLA
jgi:hypothetical protein